MSSVAPTCALPLEDHGQPDGRVMQILQSCAQGDRLERENARYLYENAPLGLLGSAAQQFRNKLQPADRVTFLIDRNINYTNVCNSDCSFCGFYRHDPKHPEAYVLSRDVLRQKISEALDLGATRILLQGGHNDELPYSYYVELISWIHQEFPIEINSFSPSEIQQMKKVSGKSYESILTELKAAGMRGLPGGGAEILDDEIRRRVSPKKITAAEWLHVMEVAQGLDLTTTSTMVFGFGESIEHRLNHLERLRSLQDTSLKRGHAGFNAFISWPLQHNQNTSLGRSRHASQYGASAVEYLRLAAVARLYLDTIPHMQASWPTLGIEVGKIALHFGCDDIGSTMMEENVVSQAGALTKNCWSLSPDELMSAIRSAGFRPAQRNSSFEIVQDFEAATLRR